jgi:hypothetical protein
MLSFCAHDDEFDGVLVVPPEQYQCTTRLVVDKNTTNTPLEFGGISKAPPLGPRRHFISTSSGGQI